MSVDFMFTLYIMFKFVVVSVLIFLFTLSHIFFLLFYFSILRFYHFFSYSFAEKPDHYALVSNLIDVYVSQSSALMPLHSAPGCQSE